MVISDFFLSFCFAAFFAFSFLFFLFLYFLLILSKIYFLVHFVVSYFCLFFSLSVFSVSLYICIHTLCIVFQFQFISFWPLDLQWILYIMLCIASAMNNTSFTVSFDIENKQNTNVYDIIIYYISYTQF
jgi:hypothetical protein